MDSSAIVAGAAGRPAIVDPGPIIIGRTMNRTARLLGCAILTIILGASTASLAQPARQNSASQKPNVLFIVADDMSCDLACYGHKVVKTPNLDRLASEGVRFAHAYCQYSVCNPSRTAFLSGLRSTRRKQPIVFLPNWFREHGYFVAEFGKVAHSYGISREQTKWDLQEKSSIPRVIEFLSGEHEKPLFVAVGLTHTHVGFNHTREMLALYPPEKIELSKDPDGFRENHPDAAFAGINIDTERSPADRQQYTARYYAAISTIDALVGQLLEALDHLKLRENTIVVFTSDHGLHLGERTGIYDKRTLWERTTRVPLFVSKPGHKAAGDSDALVELVDLYPTLCELCGIPQPKGLEGTSFVPLLSNPERQWKKAAFSSIFVRGTRGRAVRTARYRFIEYNGGESLLLYDHRSDADEYVNLAGEAAYSETMAELGKLLEAGWQAALPPGE